MNLKEIARNMKREIRDALQGIDSNPEHIEPEAFKKDNAGLCTLGLQRVDVQLDHQQEWERGKRIIQEWKRAPNAVEQVDS